MESATLEATSSSTRGGAWQPSTSASPPGSYELPEATRRAPEEAQEPSLRHQRGHADHAAAPIKELGIDHGDLVNDQAAHLAPEVGGGLAAHVAECLRRAVRHARARPGCGGRREVANRTTSARRQRRQGLAPAKTEPSVFDVLPGLLCSVCPSAIRAATPVGAVTRTPLTPCCSLRAPMILRSVNDLPVPGQG